MNVIKTGRGFEVIAIPTYANEPVDARLLGQSSAIGDYENSMDQPGSSFLWFGNQHHLNREQVSEVVEHLQAWLKTGSLEIAKT